jgi:hypothetical protein
MKGKKTLKQLSDRVFDSFRQNELIYKYSHSEYARIHTHTHTQTD